MAKTILGRVKGLSAYEVWLAQGNSGTMEDYLAAIKGDKGDPGNVMYATFDIDFDTDELVMTIPDGYTGPTFSINDETGELEVSI